MEILVALAIGLSALVAGYFVADLRARRQLELDLREKTKLLNENLENFARAYAEFNNRSLEQDNRLNSLEFRVNGTEKVK